MTSFNPLDIETSYDILIKPYWGEDSLLFIFACAPSKGVINSIKEIVNSYPKYIFEDNTAESNNDPIYRNIFGDIAVYFGNNCDFNQVAYSFKKVLKEKHNLTIKIERNNDKRVYQEPCPLSYDNFSFEDFT
jgi:hypothetical protein